MVTFADFPVTKNDDLSKMYSQLISETIDEFTAASNNARPKPFAPTADDIASWQTKNLTKTQKAELAKARDAINEAQKVIAKFRDLALTDLRPIDEDITDAKTRARIYKRKLIGQFETLRDYASLAKDQAVVDWANEALNKLQGTVAKPGEPKKSDARKWLQENGHPVNDRGRIPAHLMAMVPSQFK